MSGERANAGGGIQSLVFYLSAIELLKAQNLDVFGQGRTIHDHGCSQGDGTALLQAAYSSALVKGFDFSPEAIKIAQQRWPTMEFEVCDVREANEPASIIISSHTLEHVPEASKVAEHLLKLCEWLVIVVPDTTGGEADKTHYLAEGTKSWLAKIRPRPIRTVTYTTRRRYSLNKNPMMEANILALFRGLQ